MIITTSTNTMHLAKNVTSILYCCGIWKRVQKKICAKTGREMYKNESLRIYYEEVMVISWLLFKMNFFTVMSIWSDWADGCDDVCNNGPQRISTASTFYFQAINYLDILKFHVDNENTHFAEISRKPTLFSTIEHMLCFKPHPDFFYPIRFQHVGVTTL